MTGIYLNSHHGISETLRQATDSILVVCLFLGKERELTSNQTSEEIRHVNEALHEPTYHYVNTNIHINIKMH